jgi:hypothetical protein
MTIRWYQFAVLALWLAAMSWLTVYKILPPYLKGEPPVYESAVGDKPRPPVTWHVYLNGKRLGWALSETALQPSDTTEIHSLVHLDRLPIDEVLPALLRPFAYAGEKAAGSEEWEVESNLIINPLNQLVSFYSKLHPKSGQSLVKLDGSVEGETLKLSARLGEWNHDFEVPMPENKIQDTFAPEMQLRRLHLGQTWTIVAYSPLALPSNPLDLIRERPQPPTEVLIAKVEEEVQMSWNEQVAPTWVVVYRTNSSGGPGGDRNVRNRLWIRRDGTVVRQDVLLGGYNLRFTRMSEQDAVKLRDEHKDFQRQASLETP